MTDLTPEGDPRQRDLASPDAMSYEELVEALERLTERMADRDVGIEEAVDLYERAGRLEELARERLRRVQERIGALPDGESAPPGGGPPRA